MGVHTALDTNGFYGDRVSDAELDTIDLVLLDIKTWDSERHQRLTGMDNAPTLEFARRLASRRRPVWIRYVLVPGLTDDPDDVAKTARFVGSLGNVERVDVLPFHQLGRHKWHRLGIEYVLERVDPPSLGLLERTVAAFQEVGLRAY
jgi:pyruvate formate lyase activating enzyme